MEQKNIYEILEIESSQNPPIETNDLKVNRGLLLDIFLVLILVANLLVIFTAGFTNGKGGFDSWFPIDIGILYFFIAIRLINVILVILIWSWKKIGVYGIWFTSVFFCFFNYGSAESFNLLYFADILIPIILSFLVYSKWSKFK